MLELSKTVNIIRYELGPTQILRFSSIRGIIIGSKSVYILHTTFLAVVRAVIKMRNLILNKVSYIASMYIASNQ
ncbi:hypothetical protein P8452_48363 [Trifolium repens]|nr:hypothetical protein P8452_48363 [Trifolium repens]